MLNELAKQIYDAACEKGWHDKPVAFGDAITNIHGELSEAWEEYRNGKPLDYLYYSTEINGQKWSASMKGICDKPEGVPSEFADVIIRILDNCHMYGIDIDEAVRVKMEYNRTRPFKHGGKVI